MRSKTFRKYMFTILACSVIPMMMVFSIIYIVMRQEMIQQTKKTEQRLLIEYGEKYDTMVDNLKKVSAQLYTTFGGESGIYFLDWSISKKLQAIHNNTVVQENELLTSYYVYFPNELRVIKNGSFYDAKYFPDQEALSFTEVTEKKPCFVWKGQRNAKENIDNSSVDKVVTLVRSFSNGLDKPNGYIYVNANIDKLVNMFFITDSRIYTITDLEGNLIYSSSDETLNKEEFLEFQEKSKNTEWIYHVYIEKKALLSTLQPIKIVIIIIILTALIGCIGISIITSGSFYKPVKEIIDSLHVDKGGRLANDFETIKEKFIQTEQEKLKIEEASKKFIPAYYQTIVRNLLQFERTTETNLEDENLFINTAEEYSVVVFYDYQLYMQKNEGMWGIVKPYLNLLAETNLKFVGTQMNRSVVAVIVYSDGQYKEQLFEEAVLNGIKKIQLQLTRDLEFPISIGMSSTIKEYKYLHRAYIKAIKASYYHIYFGSNEVIQEEKILRITTERVQYPFTIETTLLNALRDKNLNQAQKAVDDFNSVIEENCIDPSTVNQWVNSLRMGIVSTIERLGLDQQELLEPNDCTVFQEIDINQFNQISELNVVMKQYAQDIISYMNRSVPNKHKELIESVKKYVIQYIGDDMSLRIVAEQFHISAPYLSTVFKQQTNQNFVKYVVQVKMEFACRLLLETNMNISDIAEKTGYTNLNSFTNAFKKYYVMTPSQYRFEKMKC